MDIFSFISLLGGLAFFLFGMSVMANGLERASGGRLERILEKMTSNTFKAILLGALVTAVIQSSSATTVIIVGLVNAKLLKLRKAIGVIMGANIGTTITAHILRLSSLESSTDSIILSMLKPTTLAPVAAIIGILLFLGGRKKTHKDVGYILLGFGILFSGMFAMENALKPLQDNESFTQLFSMFSNPILGVLVGMIVTMIIQSSSASVGILQALSSTGAITFSSAFPIIMGQNIGTCITPVLASIGASKNAKRSAFVHVLFNVAGTVIFLIGIYAIQYTIGFAFWDNPINRGNIADFHTLFNLTCTILFFPFIGAFEALSKKFIKTDSSDFTEDEETAGLDERFLGSPGYAIEQARGAVVRMAQLSLANYNTSVELVHSYDKKKRERANEVEDVIDRFQSRVDQYLLKLAERDLSETENIALSEVLQVVNEFERIGDHADNISNSAADMAASGKAFSSMAIAELDALFDAVSEILDLAIKGYIEKDTSLASTIEPLEEVINILVETLKVRHSERLRNGKCSIESAFPFIQILYDLERVADHCSNIGVHVISYSGKANALDRHEYLREMHNSKTEAYQQKFDMYDKKYYERIKTINE